jgi:hypothetical protein
MRAQQQKQATEGAQFFKSLRIFEFLLDTVSTSAP